MQFISDINLDINKIMTLFSITIPLHVCYDARERRVASNSRVSAAMLAIETRKIQKEHKMKFSRVMVSAGITANATRDACSHNPCEYKCTRKSLF
jgi:hypothetical protein